MLHWKKNSPRKILRTTKHDFVKKIASKKITLEKINQSKNFTVGI